MALLAQYVRKSYIRHFLLSATAFSGTYLLIDFIEKIDNFIDKSAPVSMLILYFMSSMPLIFIRIAPIAILMAAFMTIGNLSKTGEITAMRAGGLSLIRIARPLLTITLIITTGIVLIQELAVPVSARTMKEIWNVQIKGEAGPQIVRDKVWYRSDNQMIYIDQAQAGAGRLRGITIFDLDERFNIEKRVDADRAEFKENNWLFYDTIERQFDTKSGELTDRKCLKTPLFHSTKRLKTSNMSKRLWENLPFLISGVRSIDFKLKGIILFDIRSICTRILLRHSLASSWSCSESLLRYIAAVQPVSLQG